LWSPGGAVDETHGLVGVFRELFGARVEEEGLVGCFGEERMRARARRLGVGPDGGEVKVSWNVP